MSELGTELLESMKEAVAIAQNRVPASAYVAHHIEVTSAPENVNVKAIRESMGLSQALFAARFGLSLHAIRNWEQGKRHPDPAARAYLKVIEKAPDVVRQALQS